MKKILCITLIMLAACFMNAKAEEIVLNFDHFATGPKYYNTGDWYVVLENEEDWEVYLNWFAPADNYCGTFRRKDFDHDYSYIFTPDNRENGGIHYDNIMMKINIEEVTPLLSRIVLTATIQGDDGNTYKVNAVQELLNYKATYESSIMDATFVQGEESYTIIGKNNDVDINMVVLSERITGVFNTIEYFDLDHSHVVYQGDTIQPMQIEALVDVGMIDNNTLAYGAQVEILSTDTVMYKIMMAAPFPVPTDTIHITCQNLRIEDTWASYNTITMNAHNADYEVMIMYSDNAVREQEYTEAQTVVHITNRNEGIQVESLITKMKVSQMADNNHYQAAVMARCTDNKIYDMHLSWVVPVPQDTVEVAFEGTAEASYYPANNDLLLVNHDAHYELSLNVFGVPLGGNYTLENMGSYTHLYVDAEEVEMADLTGTIYQTGDTTWMKANIIGFDSVLYQTALWYHVPTPTDTVELTLQDVPFENQLQKGYFHLYAYTEDNLHIVSLMPATHQVEGTYINDGVFSRFGEGRYDFFGDYTSVAEWNAETKEYDIYTIDQGEMVVKMDTEGNILATATIICENAKCYHITITSRFERQHLEWDSQEEPVERIFTAQDAVNLDNQIATDNLLVFTVEAADQSDMLVLYLFAEEADAEIGIPEGVYAINSSLQIGTVLASTGPNEDGSVAPSLYSTLTEDGYLERMYFFVDGTVQVSKNEDGKLHVEVHAVNSYDVPVHLVYDASGTGVENVHTPSTTNAQKRWTNGQLFIIRNGETFNAAGALVTLHAK